MIDANPREHDAIHHNFIARRILLSEYHKSLGHRMSPKDPNKSQIIHMKDIQDRFIGILNQSNLRLKEHEVLYRNIYTPTIRYVLQGSCMSALELEQASRKSKSLFLQKMAYPKTMASKVVYGCPELGGLGMLDLHVFLRTIVCQTQNLE